MSTVQTVRLPLPPIDRREVLRYAGCREDTPELSALLEACIRESDGLFTGQVCALTLPVCITPDGVMLGELCVPSRLLADTLAACDEALLFVATVGHPIDRLIRRDGRLSPARGVMLQALGTERVEGLCDTFCGQYEGLTRRVSPGYGDIPLALQRDIFRLLTPHRRVGVTLLDSLLMAPTKSVSAIAGIQRQP